MYSQKHSVVLLVIVATIGNVLGSLINYYIGKYVMHFKDRKWFPADNKMINRANGFYQKYGVWSLLLAWTPFLGDPLTIVAGIFRTNIYLFLTLVTIGKAGRYIVLAMALEKAF
ncbi:MAG: DedA family protein [Rickettsiales bacterium]|nr:DedA family protein [Rickettsiales bacterium]MDG4545072.1 DedA family protein [Rickettsiales bacterium]MDG4547195.1 DedA family protein [Rickettsiales bacterium]